MKRLPPIQLLPTFETAARLLSFKKAAEELNITPSAVSQQIKVLEESLGTALFDRQYRSLQLTTTGEDYFEKAKEIILMYNEASSEIQNQAAPSTLRITMPSIFGYEHVLPRQEELKNLLGITEIQFEISDNPADIDKQDFDGFIRAGTGNWPGVNAYHLADMRCAIVCSPEFLQANPIANLDELRHVPLLQYVDLHTQWTWFFNTFGESEAPAKGYLRFDNYKSAIDLVERGQGVMMGALPMLTPRIKSGKLVAILDLVFEPPIPTSYYFLTKIKNKENKQLQLCYRWLKTVFEELVLLDSEQKLTTTDYHS